MREHATPAVPQTAHRSLAVPGYGSLQRKLVVGAADDALEREADRRAADVMSGRRPAQSAPAGDRSPLLQRACSRCEADEERLQRLAFGAAPAIAPPSVGRVLSQAGSPLSDSVRSFMEPRFGADFSAVRVHTNPAAAASAAEVSARAYTVGSAIVFGSGAYQPDTVSGRTLIAHELAHVLQQRATAARVQRDADVRTAGRPESASIVSQASLDSALQALRTASTLVPGLSTLVSSFELIRAVVYFWEHRHEHLERLLNSLGAQIDAVPDQARASLDRFLAGAGTAAAAVGCVGEQLISLLESLAANWRSVFGSFVRDMFFVGLFERSVPTIIDNVGLLMSDISNGEFRSAVDRGVAIVTEINAIVGVLYLWFALITTVVGAAAGTEVPVAGNAVGAAAGLTLAQVVNITLLSSVVATETTRVLRGIDDMTRFWDDLDQRAEACRRVAEGVFSLALTGALFYFGPRIQGAARAIIARAAPAVRRAAAAIGSSARALTREAAAAIDEVVAPLAAAPGGLTVPFVAPEPMVTPRPPVRTPVRRTTPRTPPVAAPARPTIEPATPRGTGGRSTRRSPDLAPSTATDRRLATGVVPLTEAPLRRSECAYPTGLTPADPIPISWHKIPSLYPSPIQLDGVDYARDDPTTLPRGEPIGVPRRFWPRPGKVVQLVPEPRGRATARFRTVLESYGFDWGARRYLQADHVQDLQWADPDGENLDTFRNVWPYDGAANASAGTTQNQNQPVSFCETPNGPANVDVPIQSVKRPNGWGRFFVIRR